MKKNLIKNHNYNHIQKKKNSNQKISKEDCEDDP